MSLKNEKDDGLRDSVTESFSKAGFHRFDAGLNKAMGFMTFGLSTKLDSLLDEWGISNRAHLEAYNRRNPQNPLPNPYIANDSDEGSGKPIVKVYTFEA